MNKVIKVLVCLFLILVLLPEASTNPDIFTYDPMADVDRDGVVDATDLSRLGKAYGSCLTLPFQPNTTVVYVYQLEKDPPKVENARVAIIDPNYSYQPVQIRHTNSSGIVNFTLNPSSDYTAIAWSNTTYNYANFTTNEFGEASVAIQLGYPQLPPNWVTITFLNKTSGDLAPLYWREIVFINYELTYQYQPPPSVWVTRNIGWLFVVGFKGIANIGPWCLEESLNPGRGYGVSVWSDVGDLLASLVYTPDKNGNANVVIYID